VSKDNIGTGILQNYKLQKYGSISVVVPYCSAANFCDVLFLHVNRVDCSLHANPLTQSPGQVKIMKECLNK
jgi:hypothetical protein